MDPNAQYEQDESDDDDSSSADESDSGSESGSDWESSSDSSLGDILGVEALLGNLNVGPSTGTQLKRQKSLPNIMMLLEAEVAPDQIENPEHRAGLEKFLKRMNNVADAYFQNPESLAVPQAQKKRNSYSALEDLKQNVENKDNPACYFQEMLEGVSPQIQDGRAFSNSYWERYFLPITEKRLKAYTPEVVEAIRSQDLAKLKLVLARDGDASMEACSAQGETLLHLACRRRNEELIKFLILNAHVSTRVRDDIGKTPLHEVCWYTESRNPSQFRTIEFLMVLGPEMFFAKDKRGFTPLQYAPKSSWKDWCRFLARNKDSLREKVAKMEFS